MAAANEILNCEKMGEIKRRTELLFTEAESKLDRFPYPVVGTPCIFCYISEHETEEMNLALW